MNGREVLVDSTAWIALLHRRDQFHQPATERYGQLVSDGRWLVTTSLILVEVANALASLQHRSLAIELERRCRETKIGELVWIDRRVHEKGWDLYRQRADKSWSLVDCTSFVLMQERKIREALTADHHFEQAGFVKLL